MGCTKKLIPQFLYTYYLGLLLKVHSTILSIQIQDSPPVERKTFFGVPAPGLCVLASTFWLICVHISMSWIYGHCNYHYPYSAGIDFRRQNIWRLPTWDLTFKVNPSFVRAKYILTFSFKYPIVYLKYYTFQFLLEYNGFHQTLTCTESLPAFMRDTYNCITYTRYLLGAWLIPHTAYQIYYVIRGRAKPWPWIWFISPDPFMYIGDSYRP